MNRSRTSRTSAGPKKLTPRRQRRAEEILAAAQACFLEKGFEGTAVSEIAQRAGITEGLVFSYFDTKRDLLHAVLSALYEPLIIDLEDGCQRMQGLRATLRFIIWRHLRVFLETPHMARLILNEVRGGPEYISSGLHDLHVLYTQPLIKALNEAIRKGELVAHLPVEMVRSTVYGTIEHLMWPTLYSGRTIDLEHTSDQLVELVMNGLSIFETQSHATGKKLPTDSRIDLRLQRIESLIEQIKTQVGSGRPGDCSSRPPSDPDVRD